MPTTIPMARHRARAASYTDKSGPGQIMALGYQVWDELHKVLASEDFQTVVTFSAIGLLVGLLTMLSGVLGVWN